MYKDIRYAPISKLADNLKTDISVIKTIDTHADTDVF